MKPKFRTGDIIVSGPHSAIILDDRGKYTYEYITSDYSSLVGTIFTCSYREWDSTCATLNESSMVKRILSEYE
jgi:hypothetical protein